MVTVLIKMLTFWLVMYVLYLWIRKSFSSRNPNAKANPSKREFTNYNKREWEKIKKTFEDQFGEDKKTKE